MSEIAKAPSTPRPGSRGRAESKEGSVWPQDRQAFEAHMVELHRCLTCPLDAARLEAIDGATEEAEQGHQEAAQAVELWPGTDVPRNQPIWPGLGVWVRSGGATRTPAQPVSEP